MSTNRLRRFLLPLCGVSGICLIFWVWRDNVLLRSQLAKLRAERVTAQVSNYQQRTSSSASNQSPPASTAGKQAVADSEAHAKPDSDVMKTLATEVVVSFGSVEQMGSRFADFFASEQARKLRTQAGKLGAPDQALSPDELAQGQRQLTDILGMLPEVEKFQDSPAEYGRFFKGLLQAGAGLSDADAGKVEALMMQRAAEGIQQGFNAGNKPSEGQWAWELKRDSFNEETAARLKEILPSNAQEIFPVDGPLMEFLEMDFAAAGLEMPTTLKR